MSWSQEISDLTAWIKENRVRGCTDASLLEAALAGGHPRGYIDEAFKSAGAPEAKLEPYPWPTSVPALTVDGFVVKVGLTLDDPKLCYFPAFLSHGECDELALLAEPKLTRATALNALTGQPEIHDARTSRGCGLESSYPIVERVERRISEALSWPLDRTEGLQVLAYQDGERYIPHYDFFNPAFPGDKHVIEADGNRVATLLMYLEEPEVGGETLFPKLGLNVQPLKGSAVLFTYTTLSAKNLSLHGGQPVTQGSKMVATKWFRQLVK